MQITRRQSVFGILLLGTLISLVVLLIRLVTFPSLTDIGIAVVALLIFGGLFAAYWRGWDNARYVLVFILTILVIISTLMDTEDVHTARSQVHIGIFIVPIIALVVANPVWVIGIASILYINELIKWYGPYQDPTNILVFVFAIGGLVLSQLVFETMAHQAETKAREAQMFATQAAEEAQLSSQRAKELALQNEQQKRLLDLVTVLETPVVSFADNVLFAPVVGYLDDRRAETLTVRLLNAVSKQQAALVILDITGVSEVSTKTAQSLIQTAQALHLLGCDVTITGISAEVAITITHLGITFMGIHTAANPQEALMKHFATKAMPSKHLNGNWQASKP